MKHKIIAVAIVVILVIGSLIFHSFSKQDHDMRGIFLYVNSGYLFGLGSVESKPPILTLAIFFSANSKCHRCLTEIEVYKRLLPLFNSNKYRMFAISSKEDSSEIVEFLRKENLPIPVMTPPIDMSFEDMGISHFYMPLKVLYDSSLTAIYVRAADNSPESQNDFENHVIRLHNLFEDESADQLEVKISVNTQ
jgi:hypothetical protein